MEFLRGFNWAVPEAFLDAIGQCRFEEGDMLYDSRAAYGENWAEAKPLIGQALQVRFPSKMKGTTTEDAKLLFENNWHTEVRLDLYLDFKTSAATHLVTTQGRLYTALWKGDVEVLTDLSRDVPVPDGLRSALKCIDSVRAKAAELGEGNAVFAMPFDQANRISRAKFTKINSALKKHLNQDPLLLQPAEAGLEEATTLVPTLEIAFFVVKELAQEQLEAMIKAEVYVPAKGAKKDMFKISAHGVIC